jgi:hypothetical protein
LIISEVFPQKIRGQAVAVAVQVNFALNAVVQFGVPILQREFGLSFMFGLFAMLTVYSIHFVYYKVPETKGLTLEEIESKFGSMAATTRSKKLFPRVTKAESDEETIQLIPTIA